MPFVAGFLRVRRRHRPGRPTDPDYGIDEGLHPDVDPPEEGGDDLEIGGGPIVPPTPPGLWPPLTPEHPWRPIPGRPGGLPPPVVGGGPAQPPTMPPQPGQPLPRPPRPTDPGWGIDEGDPPPGTIWPPLPGGVHGKYWALVAIGGMPGGTVYRYVVVDADAKPPRPGRPDQGLPGEAQPK